jgi:hypothetical protein
MWLHEHFIKCSYCFSAYFLEIFHVILLFFFLLVSVVISKDFIGLTRRFYLLLLTCFVLRFFYCLNKIHRPLNLICAHSNCIPSCLAAMASCDQLCSLQICIFRQSPFLKLCYSGFRTDFFKLVLAFSQQRPHSSENFLIEMDHRFMVVA